MRISKAIAVTAVAGAALASAQLALGAGTPPKGGTVRFFVTPVGEIKGKLTVTGAIGDYGTTISENKNGKPDATGVYTKVTLKHGGFTINTTAFNKSFDHIKPQINHSNCSVSFTATGPATLGSGTGAYAGISGTVSLTLTYAGLAPAKGSGCNLSQGPSTGVYQAVTGVGHVSFTS